MKFKPGYLIMACLLSGCFSTGENGDALVAASLSETDLVGVYSLANYLLVYTNGDEFDTSKVKLTGRLEITADSTYEETITADLPSVTRGKIVKVAVAAGGPDRGELSMNMSDEAASSTQKVVFEFLHDTLKVVTDVSKEAAKSDFGFRQTAYYVRD